MMDETVDAVPPEQRRGCNPALSGNDGGHDCHARTLADGGAVLAGRIERIDGGVACFAPGLDESLAFADEFAARFLQLRDDGWPLHVRGVSPQDGLYFVGLPWLHKRKSPLLLGVGEDAEFVADHLVTTLPRRRRPRVSRR